MASSFASMARNLSLPFRCRMAPGVVAEDTLVGTMAGISPVEISPAVSPVGHHNYKTGSIYSGSTESGGSTASSGNTTPSDNDAATARRKSENERSLKFFGLMKEPTMEDMIRDLEGVISPNHSSYYSHQPLALRDQMMPCGGEADKMVMLGLDDDGIMDTIYQSANMSLLGRRSPCKRSAGMQAGKKGLVGMPATPSCPGGVVDDCPIPSPHASAFQGLDRLSQAAARLEFDYRLEDCEAWVRL